MRHAHFVGPALAALAAIVLCGPAAGATDAASAITSALHSRYPQIKVVDIRPAPVPGLYEVFTGTELIYSDASGDHLFAGGKLVETQTKKDLAEETLQQRLAIDFDKLPFDQAIKIVKGNGSHRLAVFEDPDCPYCQKLEEQLADVKDVTLYVFLYPLTDLHPDARTHAHAIWCASDRAAAWTQWVLEQKGPGGESAAATCKSDPIEQLQKVGDQLHVSGTPTIFFVNGNRATGAFPTKQIQGLLDQPPGSPDKTKVSSAEPAARGGG